MGTLKSRVSLHLAGTAARNFFNRKAAEEVAKAAASVPAGKAKPQKIRAFNAPGYGQKAFEDQTFNVSFTKKGMVVGTNRKDEDGNDRDDLGEYGFVPGHFNAASVKESLESYRDQNGMKCSRFKIHVTNDGTDYETQSAFLSSHDFGTYDPVVS